MNPSVLNECVQVVLVLLVVAWSVLRLARQLMPRIVQERQHMLAHWLRGRGWPRLGAYLEPVAQSGCGSGCGSCRQGCETPAVEQAVRWRE